LALLGGQNTKDPDAADATILLKALQKTIQFEKEVGLELERSYGTIFNEPGKKNSNTMTSPKAAAKKSPAKNKGSTSAQDDSVTQPEEDGKASTEQDAVDKLLGVASSAFDNYMRPYIALEEKSMDEQLVQALEDRAVDTRGELPVFTTSTKRTSLVK
jgi:hypothetical protein